MHLAFHFLGCIDRRDARIATRGAIGPFVEALAPLVTRLTLLAWDPPPVEREEIDRTDYELPLPANVDFCSLGPKGTWRTYASRRAEIRDIVRSRGTSWDVLLFRLVNRRAELVFDANPCPRVVSWIGGHTPSVVRATPMPFTRKTLSAANAWWAERHVNRIIHASGLAFANSEHLRDRYSRVNPDVRILRTSSRSERFAHRAEDRLQTPSPRFVLVGRLTEAKGVDIAVEAFASIVKNLLPDAVLDIVGDGEARASLQAKCAALGVENRVVFHGFVPMGESLFERFAAADVMLFLSHEEGFPRVVWEALAHSVLVVSSRVGALPDVFTHGKEVMFVDRTPQAIVAAVRTLLEDPALRKGLIQRGFDRARVVTVEASARQLIEGILQRWPELRRESIANA